jgi:hypothetical protein
VPSSRQDGRRLAEAAERSPGERGKSEHGRFAPEDLRGRDRHHGHRLELDVGACLVAVYLQEHVPDARLMGDDDLYLFHAGHDRGEPPPESPVWFVSDCGPGRVALIQTPKRFDDDLPESMTVGRLSRSISQTLGGCAPSDKSHIVLKRFEGWPRRSGCTRA